MLFLTETLVAVLADERAFSSVNSFVRLYVRRIGEFRPALITNEWPFASVSSFVPRFLTFLSESRTTVRKSCNQVIYKKIFG